MPPDQAYLLDILESARLAVAYLQGVSKEAFIQNIQLQDAVVRRIEIVGEAARRVSQDTRESISEVPWAEMIGMRNLMIYDYDDIDPEIVWDTVQNDLPDLINQIEPHVPEAGGRT